MTVIEFLTKLYPVASGIADYVAISGRKYCVNPIQESAEVVRAVGDVASGAGTVAQGVGLVVVGYARVVADTYGADPVASSRSVSRTHSISRYQV
jgi:hypothetical protein